MKVWPFDTAAEDRRNGDPRRRPRSRARGRAGHPRGGAGDALMVELHGLWNLRRGDDDLPRARAVRAVLGRGSDPAGRRSTPSPGSGRRSCPLATGRDGRRPAWIPAAAPARCGRRVTADVQWTGGLTEARRIATLADTFGVPIAPHDCTGPVTFAACVHLVVSQPQRPGPGNCARLPADVVRRAGRRLTGHRRRPRRTVARAGPWRAPGAGPHRSGRRDAPGLSPLTTRLLSVRAAAAPAGRSNAARPPKKMAASRSAAARHGGIAMARGRVRRFSTMSRSA